MSRQNKGLSAILAMTALILTLFFTSISGGFMGEVSAAESIRTSGSFHLKRYVNVGDDGKTATGEEEDTGDTSNLLYGKETAAGVVYEIYRTHDYVSGKMVEITPVAVLDNGKNYQTNADGEINIENLPLGQYNFKEISAPEGILGNSKEYTFVLPYVLKGSTELRYDVYVYPKSVKLTGTLALKKVGDDEETGLKNVVFEVYHAEDGTPVMADDNKTLSIATRLSGEAVIEDLAVGKYYLIEAQNPDSDYLANNQTKYWFEVYIEDGEAKTRAFYTDEKMNTKFKDSDGTDLADGTIINYKVPSVKKTSSPKSTQDVTNGLVYVDGQGNLYANVDIPYVYTITTTLPKDLAAYSKFEIYDAFDSGNIVPVTELADIKPVVRGGSSQPDLTSGNDYQVVREGTAGYRLKLTDAGIAKLAAAKCTSLDVTFDAKIPAGYRVDKTTATAGENNDAIVEFDTSHSDPGVSSNRNTVYPRAGEIVVHKVANTDISKLLAGAEFSLKGADGTEYWGSDHVTYLDVNGKITSNAGAAAAFIFSQLPYGIYTLEETKAPEGYSLSKNVETINLSPESDQTATWVSREIIFRNTLSASQTKPSGTTGSGSSTKTGDETNLWLYIVSLLGSGIVIAGVLYKKSRKMKAK